MQDIDVAGAVSRVLKDVKGLDIFMFYLKIEKGVTIRDIADVTGFSQDQVSIRLRKIYERIGEELKKDGIRV